MKKSLSLALLFASLPLVLNVSMFAQTAKPAAQSDRSEPNTIDDEDVQLLRQNLRQQRKEIVAANIALSPDQAAKFWPIFDEYRKEAIKPNDERWALIQGYVANYDTMTEAQAQDYMTRSTAVEHQLLDLRMKYVPIFEKVISAKQTALFYQIDHRVDLLINLQLASQIPMVNAATK